VVAGVDVPEVAPETRPEGELSGTDSVGDEGDEEDDEDADDSNGVVEGEGRDSTAGSNVCWTKSSAACSILFSRFPNMDTSRARMPEASRLSRSLIRLCDFFVSCVKRIATRTRKTGATIGTMAIRTRLRGKRHSMKGPGIVWGLSDAKVSAHVRG